MCGIVGLLDLTAGAVSPALIESMRDAMLHRGPDGQGLFVEGHLGLAMRRLSIIDLEGGDQPFFAANGNVVAFQNGEIYNFRLLRDELETRGAVFVSDCDTEVLAHGYAAWGIEGLLKKLDGMYALAILDRRSQELHLARDRCGEKPLFFTADRGRFAFCSDMRVLAALPWVSGGFDVGSLQRYLALHFVPGDRTILEGVERLLPGERMVVALSTAEVRRFRYDSPPLRSEPVDDDSLLDLLRESVGSRLIADVPVGVFLSGGIDSSIIAALAAAKSSQINTFSMGFKEAEQDESRFARQVAEHLSSTHHHFVFDDTSFRELVPAVARSLDEPLGDQAALPLYWLCKAARDDVTVVLSGEGADEVFAGYDYYRPFLRSRFNGSRNPLLGDAPPPVTPSGFPLLTCAADRMRYTGDESVVAEDWEVDLIDRLSLARNGLQHATAVDFTTWLPDDLLVKFDRMTMAHSLEGRAPYLQPAVVAAGLGLPVEEKMGAGVSKIALRRVAARLLPAEIVDRPKQGFVLPMARWIRGWFADHGSAKRYFASCSVPRLDMAEVGADVEREMRQGIARERLHFALIMLVEWYRAFRENRAELTRVYAANV